MLKRNVKVAPATISSEPAGTDAPKIVAVLVKIKPSGAGPTAVVATA
jgi:hypothetical protein